MARLNGALASARMLTTALVTQGLDLVFPPRCVGCLRFGAFLCDICAETAPRADGVRCETCWQPGHEESCLSCYRHPPAFKALRSAFIYAGPARSAVHALKFDGVSALAPMMGSLMAEALRVWSPPVDVIVPVPLPGVRKRTRGYNQSELLAREIGRVCGLPVEPGALRRVRRTPPQVHQADEDARRRNVRDAFADGLGTVTGGLLLVDDVATTGATLDACARVLLGAGAERVFCLTFARED